MPEAPEPAQPARARVPGRARRAVAVAASALGGLVVFAAALAGGVVLHRNVAPIRRLVCAAINGALAGVLQGKIVIDGIDRIERRHVDASSASLLDPRGGVVARVRGVHADADLFAIARAALSGDGDLIVRVERARVDEAELELARGPDGKLTIVEATALPPPGPPPAVSPPPPRPVRFTLASLAITHADVHGEVAPGRPLHAVASEIAGSIRVAPEGVAIDAGSSSIVDDAFLGRPGAPSPTTTLDARVGVTVDPEHVVVKIAARGDAGGMPLDATLTLDGDVLDGHAIVAKAEPARVAAIVPGWPIRRAVAVDATFTGQIPSFDVRARATIEGSTGAIVADGAFEAGWPLRVEADVSARAIDPRAFVDLEGLAPITLEGRARVLVDDAPHVSAEARIEPGRFNGTPTPAVQAFVALERGVVWGSATFDEKGIAGAGSFSYAADRGLAFAASATVPDLRAAPRLGAPVGGAARVRVEGRLRGDALDAGVRAEIDRVDDGRGTRAEHATVDGRVKGPISSLAIDATVVGRDVESNGFAYGKAKARVHGPVLAPRVEADLGDGDDAIAASAIVDVAGRGAREVRVEVRRDGAVVKGEVARVAAGPRGVELHGVDLAGDGVGALRGNVVVRGKELSGKLHGEDVDLARVASLAGLSSPLRGLADVDVDLTPDGHGGRRGHVQLALEDGRVSALSGLGAQVEATFDGQNVRADGLVRLIAKADANAPSDDRCDGAIAEVRFSDGEGTLKGGVLDASTWQALAGRVKLAADDWDLRCLGKLGVVPFVLSDLRGRMTTTATLSRATGARFPKLEDLALRTRGLEIAGPGTLLGDGPAWASRRIDVKVTGSVDGASGKVDTVIALLGDDDLALTKGLETAGIELETTLDVAALLDDPKRRGELLRTTKLAANFVLPERPIGALPFPTGIPGLPPPIDGTLTLAGTFDGTIEEPSVRISAQGKNLVHVASKGVSPWAMPVDLKAEATYDGRAISIEGKVHHETREIAHVAGRGTIAARALARDEPTPYTASMEIDVSELPFGEIPFFADRSIGGHVSGSLQLENLNDKPTLGVLLDLPDLRIGDDVFFEDGRLSLAIERKPDDANGAIGRASLGLALQSGGRVDLAGFTGLSWPTGGVPDLDAESPAEISANADRFRLGALLPFTGGTLSRLDGSLDGHFLLFKPQGKDAKATLDARGEVKDGLVNVPQIGQEFRDLSIKIRSQGNELHLDDLVADGVRGRLRGSAVATLEGIRPKGTHLELSIADGDDLPITVEGVPLGDARGKLAVDSTIEDRTIRAKVDVSRLHMSLPAESGRNVQPLEDDPSITVSHRLAPEKDERAPDALTLDATVSLGNVVLEGKNVWVSLANGPTPVHLVLSDKLHTSGDIQVSGGRFEVLGKQFKIEEKSLVHLRDEEPANPYLNVTASWSSPDGQDIYVDYVGVLYPILPSKLRFRSSATDDQSKILATLLFGSDLDDATIKKTSTDTTQQAQNGFAGAGGALAAAQFNAILAGISPLSNFQTRIGSSQEGNLQTTLVYQIGDTVSASATFENGSSGSPGSTATTAQNTGSTPAKGSRTTIALDWRFWPHWLVRGNVGYGADTTTSGLDLLWQYRY